MKELEALVDYKRKHRLWGNLPLIAVVGWNYKTNIEVARRLAVQLSDQSLFASLYMLDYPVDFDALGKVIDYNWVGDDAMLYWQLAITTASKGLTFMNNEAAHLWVVPNAPNPSFNIDYAVRKDLINSISADTNVDQLYEDMRYSGIVMGELQTLFTTNILRSPTISLLKPLITIVVDEAVEHNNNEFEYLYEKHMAHYYRSYVAHEYSSELGQHVLNTPYQMSAQLAIDTSTKDTPILYLPINKGADLTRLVKKLNKQLINKLPKYCGLQLYDFIQHSKAFTHQLEEGEKLN